MKIQRIQYPDDYIKPKEFGFCPYCGQFLTTMFWQNQPNICYRCLHKQGLYKRPSWSFKNILAILAYYCIPYYKRTTLLHNKLLYKRQYIATKRRQQGFQPLFWMNK
jgi:hypothetical protein